VDRYRLREIGENGSPCAGDSHVKGCLSSLTVIAKHEWCGEVVWEEMLWQSYSQLSDTKSSVRLLRPRPDIIGTCPHNDILGEIRRDFRPVRCTLLIAVSVSDIFHTCGRG
jgi:hypothetical protein